MDDDGVTYEPYQRIMFSNSLMARIESNVLSATIYIMDESCKRTTCTFSI
jgi:hypothetical protein